MSPRARKFNVSEAVARMLQGCPRTSRRASRRPIYGTPATNSSGEKKKILLKLNRKRISSQRHERKQEPGLYKKCISCEARRKSSEACVTRWLGSGWQRERAATPPGFWGTGGPDRSHPGAVGGKTKSYKVPHHHGKEEARPQENPRADAGQLGCPTPLPHPPKGTAPADISPN